MPREYFDPLELIDSVTSADTPIQDAGFCRLGPLAAPATMLAQEILGLPTTQFQLLVDTSAVRHILGQHGLGRSRLEAARGQIPIVEADFVELMNWLPVPTTVRAGVLNSSKPPRLELESQLASGMITAVVEWRPKRKQLALVTLYKKSRLPE